MAAAKKDEKAEGKSAAKSITIKSARMQKEPLTAIIILNWNRWQDTIRCLESIYQSTYKNFFVVLIDNGSTDGSVERFKLWAQGDRKDGSLVQVGAAHKKPGAFCFITRAAAASAGHTSEEFCAGQLIVIENEKNYGFAGGNNIAIKYAFAMTEARYVLLLNNDTTIAPAGISALVLCAEEDMPTGAFQAKMLSMDSPEIIDALGISMIDLQGPCPVGNGHPDTGQFSSCREIFGVCAGAALYRRTMLEQIGLFDEDFFAYYEDVDLALRACLRGWKALCVPDAIVYHGHSATLGKDSPFKTYLLERNRYYYIIKNAPRDILWLFIKGRPDAFLRILIQLLKAGSSKQVSAYLRGNLRGLAGLPGMFMKRRKLRSCGQMHDSELRTWLLK